MIPKPGTPSPPILVASFSGVIALLVMWMRRKMTEVQESACGTLTNTQAICNGTVPEIVLRLESIA
jgi:hypothetical protein